MIIKFDDYDVDIFRIDKLEKFLKGRNIPYQEVYTKRNFEEGNTFIVTECEIPELEGNYEIVTEITGDAVTDDYEVIEIPQKTRDHMEDHSDVEWNHVKQAIAKIDLNGNDFFMETIDLGYIIGKSSLVSSEGRSVKMLYRKGRAGKSPIIVNGLKTPTSQITIGICKNECGDYCLFTAFYGEKAEREPWDRNIKTDAEREASEKFWATHALICTADEIDWEKSK